ncbi:MAG: sarcosine oxidase, subunit gamma [Actinomycetota bacterium]|nr:sarcosine oxidase, subunit gamma [Actinomycetota bacterium]
MADLRMQSPVADRAADVAKIAELTGGAVQIAEVAFLQQIDVRTRTPGSFRLPTDPNTWHDVDGSDALWLGPDEWLLVADPAADHGATAPDAESVVDVGANRAVLDLIGPGVRDLLSKGCSLDLHATRWRDGACAQTMLAKAPVILQQRGKVTRVFVRPSFADYLVDWLLAACG